MARISKFRRRLRAQRVSVIAVTVAAFAILGVVYAAPLPAVKTAHRNGQTIPAAASLAPNSESGDSAGAAAPENNHRHGRVVEMVVTAYCPCPLCCGPNARGITASGQSVYANGMKLAAADTRVLPFGTLVSIPGYRNGQPVPILDRGQSIKGNRLDVLMPTHQAALHWGKKNLLVTIYDQ